MLRYALVFAIGVAGCSSGHTSPSGTGATSTMAIDQTGGSISVEGATLVVPAGALSAASMITVTSTTTAAPSAFKAWSPVYQFAPEGLTFNTPATLTLTASAGAPTNLVVYWSNASGGYDALDTNAVSGAFQASVTHFSKGFIAQPNGAMATPMDMSMDKSTCSAGQCGACTSNCSGMTPFAVCRGESPDKTGACPVMSTCTCQATDPTRTCTAPAVPVCNDPGCTITCPDATPYPLCNGVSVDKLGNCSGSSQCGCQAGPPDMSSPGGGGSK